MRGDRKAITHRMPVRRQGACPSSLHALYFTLWVKTYFHFKCGNSASGRAGLKLEQRHLTAKSGFGPGFRSPGWAVTPTTWKLSPASKEGLWHRLPGSTARVFSAPRCFSRPHFPGSFAAHKATWQWASQWVSRRKPRPAHKATWRRASQWMSRREPRPGWGDTKDACPLHHFFPLCQLDCACGGQCEHNGKW